VAVIALCAAAATAAFWVQGRDGSPAKTPAAAEPSVTQRPSVPPGSSQPATTTPAAQASVGAPVRVRVDAVRLDAEVVPTASVGGAFDPPSLTRAYWIEAFGAPGAESDNTVYLIGHSWDNGDAVFNPLFDRATQTSRVEPGDTVVVTTDAGEVTYEVERAERIPREEVAQEDNEVWDVVPGRLLLVTCFQNNGGGDAFDNFVVFAHVLR